MENVEYANAYSEVLEILKYISEEEYNKIPIDKINFFKANANKNYLERKKTNRKLRAAILKERKDYELEYLRHLQWQHSIEMSKRYLV